ncbi:hypothetical protein A2130_02495 [Candidatus Woesebacteria bacterium GWC2_33_12]|uniref:PIN domain-containing protein n=1 Tax=Candidatus Woesebacteria bacterium GW2011_GWB1_33_22 TaxID=1618566 RepID=A0A0F9ZL52_9BACT|nr:MAG: hypothetical protein UR29_C0021G0006 [Candidatus Woesebacteria bacterium GW2011_GWC2_33_12]KKP42020.1 MAG: hypothetical protein UR33_C0006G0004 [Candidatus Woesebacteria bacterium GW2011_GWA2_33_20]KKP44829.1 MAG: hypothetical protein UR35_C0006G0064 [Candidatus Woesebacteria bacterium GW2011_GWB1_33_22]KKP45055.1 MAG: hypothetical protein UR37_C0021G0006 [Microgenomates group bacterium GW2011_GWC1_33_28]KKP50561.1 MAG: hypothetical protein UR41_C0006G0064 [Candidatus Woesebacteria bact
MAKGRSTISLFLDSSVLFSATYSVIGGSSKLFTLKNIKLNVSKVVLHEVEKNVRQKLESYHLDRFFMLTSKLNILDNYLNDNLIKKAKKYIVEKDSVILAEFLNSNCKYLITLDKKDFLQEKVIKFVKPKKILTPKMFLEANK